MGEGKTGWLGLGYKMASLPSRCRVQVWRRLKDVGAVYYQQGMVILPHTERLLAYVTALRSDIIRFGGEASVVTMHFLDEEDENAVVAQFVENVRSDYNELERLFLRVTDDIERFRSAGKLTQAMLEEKLGVLRKARRVYEKLRQRDHFKALSGQKIEELMKISLAKIDTCLLEVRVGD